jgi:hypothetical protein
MAADGAVVARACIVDGGGFQAAAVAAVAARMDAQRQRLARLRDGGGSYGCGGGSHGCADSGTVALAMGWGTRKEEKKTTEKMS